ncbi:MAG: LysR family transcriptional regulator, partial [Burkholderiales bacterium]|nr:LysR family transcriptional regulator [Burkholderiales bacterium]
LGRVDCAVVYNVTPAAAFDLVPVLDEPLFLVSARGAAPEPVGRPVTLARVAEHELVMPSRPHSIRMLLETALAAASLKARIDLEIESVPAILDLVERNPMHAVLALNALRGREAAFVARPILLAKEGPFLATKLWIATSAQRPRGPLVEQGSALLVEMLNRLLI